MTFPILLDGTGLAQIIGGKSFGVASEASLGCIKVGRDDQPYPEIKDIADAIRGAVDIAGALNVPAVIVLGWVTDLSQVLDDAVRIFTVSWGNTYIEMRSTGLQRFGERHPRHQWCRNLYRR